MRPIILACLAACLVLSGCLTVPAGLHVYESPDGCTSDSRCSGQQNYYWSPTHEVVMQPGQPLKVIAHEVCHAHQQQEVQDELHEPVSIDEHEWYRTAEYRAFRAVVDGRGYPTTWHLSARTDLELFAEACGRYLTRGSDPAPYGPFPSDPVYDMFFRNRGF